MFDTVRAAATLDSVRPNRCLWSIRAMLLAGVTASQAMPSLLGRSPVSDVSHIQAGRFVSADIVDIVVVEELGSSVLPQPGGRPADTLGAFRLHLLRLSGVNFRAVWRSRPLLRLAGPAGTTHINPWSAGDVDGDGRDELLLVSGGRIEILSFDSESTWSVTHDVSTALIGDIVACDLDADSALELVTLESGSDGDRLTLVLRAYQLGRDSIIPMTPYIAGLNWGSGTEVAFIGTARLSDYDGLLPVLVASYAELRPSTYAVVHQETQDSILLSPNPFPWAAWFSKDRVLAAGPLRLFNAGDTLVAYGYFVPGSRPGGPSRSFAALLDGEWELLEIAPQARRLAGPLCRFSANGLAGWLELREEVFHFYPGSVFENPAGATDAPRPADVDRPSGGN